MMKKIVLSVVLFIIAIISMRAVYNRATAPTTPTAFILGDRIEGREGPDERYGTNAYLLSVYRYPVTGRDSTGTWWQLDVDGRSSWIHESDVSLASVENVPIAVMPCRNTVSPHCPARRQMRFVNSQRFEYGIILWVQGFEQVYVLQDYDESMDYGYFSEYLNEWDEQAVMLEMSPDGLQQPHGRFGYLWHNVRIIRSSLGWATDSQIDYRTAVEISGYTSFSPSDNTIYLRLPDGRGIGINRYAARWFFVE
jgi:hypothetical protein